MSPRLESYLFAMCVYWFAYFVCTLEVNPQPFCFMTPQEVDEYVHFVV